jgi:hypothetical protein
MQFKADVDDRERLRIVRLVGCLRREHLPELTKLCDESPMPLRLDLVDLVSSDAAGLDALLLWQSRGAEVAGASRHVALLLERVQQNTPAVVKGEPGQTRPAPQR